MLMWYAVNFQQTHTHFSSVVLILWIVLGAYVYVLLLLRSSSRDRLAHSDRSEKGVMTGIVVLLVHTVLRLRCLYHC
jgi:Ni/Fe-hydrogenase subunit HybB-like protein